MFSFNCGVTFLIEYTMFKLFLFLLQYSTEIKIIFLYFNFLRFVPKQYTKTKNFCVYFSLFVPKLFKLNLLLILISFQFFSRTKNNLYIPQSPRIRINHIAIFCSWLCGQLPAVVPVVAVLLHQHHPHGRLAVPGLEQVTLHDHQCSRSRSGCIRIILPDPDLQIKNYG